MDRRRFLATTLATTAVLRSRLSLAQPKTNTHGAIVIGVDKVGNLEPLKGAASGAIAVHEWLKGEGYKSRLFADKPFPENESCPDNESCTVKIGDIKNAISAFVNAGTYEQLVIYFAGHGFIHGTLSEFWVLSGATEDSDEAVSLTESARFAELSPIPNVAFISDACRSPPNTFATMLLDGGRIFPPPVNRSPRTADVDLFLAARIGAFAYEGSLESGLPSEGVYTSCFLEAFKRPYPHMVETISGLRVVPNRRLEDYLSAEVPKKARELKKTLNQEPDTKVVSKDSVYLAKVSTSERANEETAILPSVTVAEVAKAEIEPEYLERRFEWERQKVQACRNRSDPACADDGELPTADQMVEIQRQSFDSKRSSSGFAAAKNSLEAAQGLSSFLRSRSGITVSGHIVKSIVTRSDLPSRITRSLPGSPASSLIEIDLGDLRATTVAIRFADDTGTVLAALRDYVGNVVADKSGVKNVSYVPSASSPLRGAYESESGRLENLRASVATAAQFGVFRFDGTRDERQRKAAGLANRIRVLKGIDPTLGIYAAYAYDDAGVKEQVHSVRNYMRGDLGVDLFDVALLLDVSERPRPQDMTLYPCCPMLSQGWGLLRVKQMPLTAGLARARDHLRVSLWNSLDPQGISLVENALRSGAVT